MNTTLNTSMSGLVEASPSQEQTVGNVKVERSADSDAALLSLQKGTSDTPGFTAA